VTGLANSRQNFAISHCSVVRGNSTNRNSIASTPSAKCILITGQECRRSLYGARNRWHRVRDRCTNSVNSEGRSIFGQREFARLLGVTLETLRTWDSGRRPVPLAVLRRASDAAAHHQQQHKVVSLAELANTLGVHVRTLQAAARTRRLTTHFSVRSVFGRPMRFASRAAGEEFLVTHYRRFSGHQTCPPPLPVVPDDYDMQLRYLRSNLQLTQADLAQHLGAASKAVVYQWESRKRTPSPVFWQRVLQLASRGRPAKARDLALARSPAAGLAPGAVGHTINRGRDTKMKESISSLSLIRL
jgi:DNA-binding transcriptional regulator YiaG